jgi:hypothetical protein
MQDPELYSLDSAVGFGQFARLLGDHFDPRLIADKYDEYRNNYDKRQVEIYFKAHSHQAWSVMVCVICLSVSNG